MTDFLINALASEWELYLLVLVIGIGILWLRLNYARLRGKMGEGFVATQLRRLDHRRYRVLSDLLLPSSGSLATTQIDHVVISNYGVFCIETKDYRGWIFGNADQKYWTQVIYKSKNRFYNPTWQNHVHVKAIETLIKPLCPNTSIISFVVFPSAGKLRVSGTDSVGYTKDLLKKIHSFKQQVFSDVDRDKIYDTLLESNIEDKTIRKSHDKGVRVLKK